MGALTTSIYHTQYTCNSLVGAPSRYLGRLWDSNPIYDSDFFVVSCSLELFMFIIYSPSCKLTNFHLLPYFFHKTSLNNSVFTDLCKPFSVHTSKVQRFFEKTMPKGTQHGCHHSKAQLPHSVPVSLFKWV